MAVVSNNRYANGAAVANVAATGVVTPANAAYTQADQTALANAVVELRDKVNLVLAALRDAGTLAS